MCPCPWVQVLGITDPSAQRQLALAVQAAAQPSPFEAVEAAVGQTVRLSARTASQLHNLVKPFVDSADTGTAGALWPLVRRVVLRGPWAQHIGDCVLVDAPGVQDENSSRGDMVRGYLRKADAVSVCDLTSGRHRALLGYLQLATCTCAWCFCKSFVLHDDGVIPLVCTPHAAHPCTLLWFQFWHHSELLCGMDATAMRHRPRLHHARASHASLTRIPHTYPSHVVPVLHCDRCHPRSPPGVAGVQHPARRERQERQGRHASAPEAAPGGRGAPGGPGIHCHTDRRAGEYWCRQQATGFGSRGARWMLMMMSGAAGGGVPHPTHGCGVAACKICKMTSCWSLPRAVVLMPCWRTGRVCV